MDMLSNSLTRNAGLKIGPIVLEVLCRHYFDRVKDTNQPKLSQDELLYDEAFHIVKAFLEESTLHTVEEVQAFANTRTPSPPWTLVVRLVVPMSCCDEAAVALVKALGGPEVAKRTAGGTKWWQVRGVNGVDAQWIVAKKDWREAKRRHKQRDSTAKNVNVTLETPEGEPAEPVYEPEMDDMRCILYFHGGGYFFGSTDQERYSIQRHARKINGRVFAVNYRLAPQYPFPCAIQDALAAYLFLIRPPQGASHAPVKPEHIIVAGDSAGGGISIALLQVLRDSGLPIPAGGVLISPWCDLTHSFPSVHTNTATDIIPQFGLSMQKPSTLWPPPNEEMTSKVHAGIRSRIRDAIKLNPTESVSGRSRKNSQATVRHEGPARSPTIPARMPVDVGATTHATSLDPYRQEIELVTKEGETLVVNDQMHLYAPNGLLTHPLISPALSYLGGLPPLFIVASDKEVLRDEIIYAAHKAANPDEFPVKASSKALYPALIGIEKRYGPTSVHLQIYDDTAHILPVLFSFCTPAKFCYRSIALFCKHVTGAVTANSVASGSPVSPVLGRGLSFKGPKNRPKSSSGPPAARPEVSRGRTTDDGGNPAKKSMRRSLSVNLSRAASVLRAGSIRRPSTGVEAPRPRAAVVDLDPQVLGALIEVQAPTPRSAVFVPPDVGEDEQERRFWTGSPPPMKESTPTIATGFTPSVITPSTRVSVLVGEESPKKPLLEPSLADDVAGPRFRTHLSPLKTSPTERFAGDPIVYSNTEAFPSFTKGMIRERVSTQGVVRALEPHGELDALSVPPELIGELSELAIRRYLAGKAKFDKKFASQIKTIEKDRRRHLEHAKKDTVRERSQIEKYILKEEQGPKRTTAVQEGLVALSGSWSWAWALDKDERPPPSSIASRRDTSEARRLARIADQSIFQDEHALSAGNLWSVITNFLTVGPEKGYGRENEGVEQVAVEKTAEPKRQSRFSRFMG